MNPALSPDRIVLDLAVDLVNPLNAREHWRTRVRRAAVQRLDIVLSVLIRPGQGTALKANPSRPKRVLFEVWRPRRFDDDVVAAACKHLRDGLQDAKVIHHDGPKSGHEFVYAPMQVGPSRVRITVTPRRQAGLR